MAVRFRTTALAGDAGNREDGDVQAPDPGDAPRRLEVLERLQRRLVRWVWLLAGAWVLLALYVVNVIRPPDTIHADAVETGHVETTAVKFLTHDSARPAAYLSTWPRVVTDLPNGPESLRRFTPELMLRDPGRPPVGGRAWTCRAAFDLTGDLPAIAFYDVRGELQAIMSLSADGPAVELRDPTGRVVFSTDQHTIEDERR